MKHTITFTFETDDTTKATVARTLVATTTDDPALAKAADLEKIGYEFFDRINVIAASAAK